MVAFEYITEIFNAIFRLGYNTKNWKVSKIEMLIKPR